MNENIKSIFYGTVKDGKLGILNKPRFEEYLKSFEGKEVEVVIGKKGKMRSTKQNGWYWGVAIKLIASQSGENTKEGFNRIHEFLKSRFSEPDEIKFKDKNGIEIIDLIPKSTTTLLTIEFNEYKNKIQQWASEFLGLYIPDPKEIKMNRN